jgi:putative sterol carrier protein
VGFHWGYANGRATQGTAGIDGSADLVLLLAGDDAKEVLRGDVEPSVAFMRGRLKASGDGGLLLGFLKSTTDPGFVTWREKIAALAPETAR